MDLCSRDRDESEGNDHLEENDEGDEAVAKKTFECKICNAEFSHASSLSRHRNVHTGKAAYECKVCHKVFRQQPYLKVHLRTHTGEKPYQCDICGRAFNERPNLNTHMRTHTGDFRFTCEVCNKPCIDRARLVRHQKTHSSEKSQQVEACSRFVQQKTNSRDVNVDAKHVAARENHHKCKLCNKSFADNSRLERHSRTHLKGRTYPCEECDKTFGDKANFDRHLQIHVENRNSQLEDWTKSPSLENGPLDTYTNGHTDETSFNMIGSGYSLDQKSDANPDPVNGFNLEKDPADFMHDIQPLDDENPEIGEEFSHHPLEEDGLHFDDLPDNMDDDYDGKHPLIALTEDELEQLVDLKCDAAQELSDGQHLDTRENEKPFQCDVCNKIFRSELKLQKHAKMHGVKNGQLAHKGKKSYQCNICNKSFDKKSHRDQHLGTHTNNKPFQCDICFKSFNVKSNLNRHLKTHPGTNTKCRFCNKICRGSCSSKMLVIISGEKETQKDGGQHEDVSVIVKEECAEPTVASDDADDGKADGDDDDKCFLCKVCGTKLRHASTLSRHMKIHSEDKPHQCDVCQKVFNRKCNLDLHRRMHTGEKPFQCDICGRPFSGKSNLKAHFRTHTGEKPFKCDVCNKFFSHRIRLIKHTKIHTEEKKLAE